MNRFIELAGKHQFKFLTIIFGVISITLTSFMIYIFSLYPSGISLDASTEGLIMYVLIYLGAISLITICTMWFSYILLYKMGIIQRIAEDTQEVVLYLAQTED